MLDKNKIEYFLFVSLSRFFNFFGYKRAPFWGKLLGSAFYYLIPIRKRVVFSNLRKAFPEISDSEIKVIARKNYISLMTTFIELFCVKSLTKEEAASLINVDIDLVKRKLAADKGLIFLSAHFGNWEISSTSAALQLNIPIYVLAKPQRNEMVYKAVNQLREKFGNKVISLGSSVRELYGALLKKRIIGVVGDQRGPEESLRVNLFNQPTAVYPGTAQIALKTGSPILAALIVRQPDNSYNVELEAIDVEDFEGSNEEKVLQINTRYMAFLEKWIRKHPEQWFWMHNIWKY
jgi:KDO2-lipid IV(A) lauroyltransferase